MKVARVPKVTGRPRGFDAEEALDKAMHLFWAKGYEGTTLSDLTKVMGVNRPSLYSIFGNKEELFRKAFARYLEGPASVDRLARELPTAREAVEALLYRAAQDVSNAAHPGCLSVVGALACGDEAESIQQQLSASRNAGVEAWRQRFEQAQAEGELPPEPSAASLARFLMTVVTGMTVQARGGATQEELQDMVEVALRAWPTV